MVLDNDVLEALARNGSMDYSKWPRLLEIILPRLDQIVCNEFPIPVVPNSESPSISVRPVPTTEEPKSPEQKPSSLQSQTDDNPAILSTPKATSPQQKALSPGPSIPNSQQSDLPAVPGTLPPQLLSRYSSIQATLKGSFSTAPPYTIQRLAELVLRPKEHYRTLPSYLRAIDRIISVSSTADIFPLPSLAAESELGGTSNYLATEATSLNPADDFNGAALTRIPWLRETNEMHPTPDRLMTSDLRTESTSVIDGPNGAGSIETVTVSVNGLPHLSRGSGPFRPEAETAEGAATESPPSKRITRSSTASARKEEEAAEERVHARGPDEIGMEDTGPQAASRAGGGFDVEAALGRPGEAEQVGIARRGATNSARDRDGDIAAGDSDAAGKAVADAAGVDTDMDTEAS